MSGFQVIPGDPSSSVVLHVPHSSRSIPDDVRAGIVLDDDALQAELDVMTDAFTDRLAERSAALSGCRPWLLVNRCSRLVVDPERFPDEREEMNAVGMGAVYTRTSGGDVLRAPAPTLIDRFFVPYAAALTELVQDRLDRVGTVTILDLHSFPVTPLPYELHADGPRPELCLGTDAIHTPSALIDAARQNLAPVTPTGDVGIDSPFAGTYVPLRHYGTATRVKSLMLEVRRDLLTHSPRHPDDAGINQLAAGAATLVDHLQEIA